MVVQVESPVTEPLWRPRPPGQISGNMQAIYINILTQGSKNHSSLNERHKQNMSITKCKPCQLEETSYLKVPFFKETCQNPLKAVQQDDGN